MLQASTALGVAFDPFSLQQDGLATPKVDVRGVRLLKLS